MDNLQIFSNGSGYKSCNGAAAVIPATGQVLQYKLSRSTRHTVFEGELIGMLLALKLMETHSAARTVLIALDNQAVIQALRNNSPQPLHYILNEIHTTIHRLKRR
jgi:Reverse transcriptase-like